MIRYIIKTKQLINKTKFWWGWVTTGILITRGNTNWYTMDNCLSESTKANM